MSIHKQFMEFFGVVDFKEFIAREHNISFDGDVYKMEYYSICDRCMVRIEIITNVMNNVVVFWRNDKSIRIALNSAFGCAISEACSIAHKQWREECERIEKEEELRRKKEQEMDDDLLTLIGEFTFFVDSEPDF